MTNARRIVSLLSGATEILYLLGLGDQIVAVSHECDYPAEALTKPRLTHSHVQSSASSRSIDDEVRRLSTANLPLYEIDGKRLAALSPDLIVTQAQCDVCSVRYEDVLDAIARQPSLAGTSVLALKPESLADILEDIRRVGKAAGCANRAAEVVAQLEERMARIRQGTAALSKSERPRVACIEWIDPLMLAANWMPELVELAGGANLLSRGGEPSTWSSWQEVAALDPQVLVVMPCGFDLERSIAEAAALPSLPSWQELSAVRAGRVYAVDGSAYFNRSGPRIVESLEILAHVFHSDRFGPPPGVDPRRAWRQLESGPRSSKLSRAGGGRSG